jgi:hypothetical protein
MVARGVCVLVLFISGLVGPAAHATPAGTAEVPAHVAAAAVGLGGSTTTASRPRATVSGYLEFLASGRVRASVTSNAKKVKLTYRTAKNRKRTATIKIRSGKGARTLSAGSKEIYARARATKKLRASAKLGLPTLVPPSRPPFDRTPPGQVGSLRVSGRTSSMLTLTWNNPTDSDLGRVIVRRFLGAAAPGTPTAGFEVSPLSRTATMLTDNTGLTPDTDYSYALFTVDLYGNVNLTGTTVTGRTLPAPLS